MQDEASMFWLFIFGFFQRENDKLVKGNEVFYFNFYFNLWQILYRNWKMVHYIQ